MDLRGKCISHDLKSHNALATKRLVAHVRLCRYGWANALFQRSRKVEEMSHEWIFRQLSDMTKTWGTSAGFLAFIGPEIWKYDWMQIIKSKFEKIMDRKIVTLQPALSTTLLHALDYFVMCFVHHSATSRSGDWILVFCTPSDHKIRFHHCRLWLSPVFMLTKLI